MTTDPSRRVNNGIRKWVKGGKFTGSETLPRRQHGEGWGKLICFEITCRQSWPMRHYTIYMHVLRSIQDEMSTRRLRLKLGLELRLSLSPWLLINVINENVITFSRFMTVLHNQESRSCPRLRPRFRFLSCHLLLSGILRSLMRQALVAATKAEPGIWNLDEAASSGVVNGFAVSRQENSI